VREYVHHEADAVDVADDRAVDAPLAKDHGAELHEPVRRDEQLAAHGDPLARVGGCSAHRLVG